MKIVVTGPESTGKSTLSKSLAKTFNSKWLPEYAREYLENIDRAYEEKDLLLIAQGQYERQNKISKDELPIFFDTSFEVLKIWSEWKYGHCHNEIKHLFLSEKPDLYLLMKPDLPWEEDELRETPNSRNELFDIYEQLIQATGIQYYIISGEGNQRLSKAIRKVRTTLNLDN
ncbi:MAG: ATP-binding protein [Reichenbachiella sp.]